MSSKLDKSLEEITGARRNNARRGGRGKPAAVAGGVTKKAAPARAPKAAAKPAATAIQTRGESKIIVSNLPDDVNEQQIKEYFASTVGAVKKVLLTYTRTGKSAGVATIIFQLPNSAAEAAKAYNGVKVDGKPMKIEVVMGAQQVQAAPAPKGLGDRISGPKNAAAKPRAANAAKGSAAAKPAPTPAGARGRGGRRGGKGQPRPAKKTAEQLDADMADYFDANAANGTTAAAPTNGAAAAPAAAAAGEVPMEDEIM